MKRLARIGVVWARMMAVIFGLSLVAADAKTEPAADFSFGFELLVAMGMPDLEGATWCRISPLMNRDVSPGYVGPPTPRPLQCRGWALPKVATESPQRFVIGTEERMGRSESWAQEHRESLKTSPFLRDRISNWGVESWGEISLKEDMDHVHEHLEVLEKSTPEHMTQDVSHLRKLAPFLIFATQLWQCGHVEDANALASVLFEAIESPSELIDLVIARLAFREWESVFNKFQKKPDWEQYERDLESIVAGYSRGKAHLGELRQLLELVKSQAAFQTPIVWEFPEGKEAIGQEILETLTESPMVIEPRLLSGAWILRDFEGERHGEFWGRLASEGADALHIICNLIGDPVLTKVWSHSGPDFYRYGKSYGHVYDGSFFPTMPRPYTRGELADRILGGVIPHRLKAFLFEDGFGQEAQMRIREWCEGQEAKARWSVDLEGKSRGSLALAYLQEREHMRQYTVEERVDAALAWLAASENPEDCAKTEAVLLAWLREIEASDSRWYRFFEHVRSYLRARGEVAMGFYEKILPLMERKLDEALVVHPKHKYNTDFARDVVVELKSRFEGNLLSAMLADLNEGASWDELGGAIWQILMDGPAEEVWPNVLKFVSETDNRAAKFPLLYIMSNVSSAAEQGEISQTLDDFKLAILKPELSNLWLDLLEDDSVYQHPEQLYPYPSPQESVIRLMDGFSADVFHGENMKSLYDREIFRQRLMAQARAVILDEVPPPWPSTASLDRVRKEMLIDDCETQTGQSFLVWYRGLTEDERLYIVEHIGRGASRVPIREARSYVGRIEITTEAVRNAYPWNDLLGKLLTYDELVALVDKLRSVEVTSRAILELVDGSLYEGTVIAEASDVAMRGFYFEQMPQGSMLQVMSGMRSFCWAPTGKSLLARDDSKRFEATFERNRYLWGLRFYIKPLSAVDH